MALSVLVNFAWRTVSRQDILLLDPECISVYGNSMVSENEIVSGLSYIYGSNILRLDLRELASEIEKLPRIRKAGIKRDYPGGLKISVEEVIPAGYLLADGIRHAVTACGTVFPGTEGPAIRFKTEDPKKIRALSRLLNEVREVGPDFYSAVNAVDMNYRNEVIIYTDSYYCKWPQIEYLDRGTVKKNILLSEKIQHDHLETGKELSYIDMRFLSYSKNGADGAVIIK